MGRQICDFCEIGELTPEVHTITFRDGLVVEGLERYRCDHCNADPVFPDQIKRNDERVKQARTQFSAQEGR